MTKQVFAKALMGMICFNTRRALQTYEIELKGILKPPPPPHPTRPPQQIFTKAIMITQLRVVS